MTWREGGRRIIQAILFQQLNVTLANLLHVLHRKRVNFGTKRFDTSLHRLYEMRLTLAF